MVQQQDTPGSLSDVPKRSFFRNLGKKQIIYSIIPLLLINAGIIHTLVGQITPRVNAEAVVMVKDETAAADSEAQVPDDTTPEDTIDDTPAITTYVVKSGDTLGAIAEKFNISVNTIRWANDLTEKTSKINIGDELVILPVTGVEYTVKKGDTLSGIATKFDASQDDILKYNDIEADAIKVGTELIIPGAEPIKAPVKKPATKPAASPATSTPKSTDTDDKPVTTNATYANPVPGAVLTQGIHDGNAVDFGVDVGTPVLASASGTVIIAKDAGYNGGYGKYIVITHPGGSQTLYGHLSTVSVSVGQTVTQGQIIGHSGNTGLSTGPHLHFKILNGPSNPFAKYKVGTHF